MDLQYRLHVLGFLCDATGVCAERGASSLSPANCTGYQYQIITNMPVCLLLPGRAVKVQLVSTPPVLTRSQATATVSIIGTSISFIALPCHAFLSFAKIQYDTSQTYICCLTPPALNSFPVSLFHQICSCRRACPMNQHPLLPNGTLSLHYANYLVCKPLSELSPSTTSRLLLVGCV